MDMKDISSQERLEQLGYKQELERYLTTGTNVVMSVANVAPIMAVFVLAYQQ